MKPEASFRLKVETLISKVPAGQVTTYGDIAALAGSPLASRVVGGIAHYGDPILPWHRLVNSRGQLARGYHGGRRTQAEHLAAEGVSCTNQMVDNFNDIRWKPDLKGKYFE